MYKLEREGVYMYKIRCEKKRFLLQVELACQVGRSLRVARRAYCCSLLAPRARPDCIHTAASRTDCLNLDRGFSGNAVETARSRESCVSSSTTGSVSRVNRTGRVREGTLLNGSLTSLF